MNLGIYTAQGTQVANIYATSDGTISGDAYFFQHPDEDDDYVERFAVGDYFAEDYVEFGNPFKNIEKNFTGTSTGEYATDYFAHDDGRYTFLFSEVSAEVFRIDDSTAFETAITVSADTVDWAESVSISFVFFRNPSDTFDIADSAPVIEAQPRPSDTMGVADAVSKLDIGRNPSDTPTWADSTAFDVTTTADDTMGIADSTAFDVVFGTIDDTFTIGDSLTPELGRSFSDAMTMADSVDKFDIGVAQVIPWVSLTLLMDSWYPELEQIRWTFLIRPHLKLLTLKRTLWVLPKVVTLYHNPIQLI